jgi:hypothetical protein
MAAKWFIQLKMLTIQKNIFSSTIIYTDTYTAYLSFPLAYGKK